MNLRVIFDRAFSKPVSLTLEALRRTYAMTDEEVVSLLAGDSVTLADGVRVETARDVPGAPESATRLAAPTTEVFAFTYAIEAPWSPDLHGEELGPYRETSEADANRRAQDHVRCVFGSDERAYARLVNKAPTGCRRSA